MNNFKENIGIIGQGFVGTAIREKFKKHYNVYTYDKDENLESKIFSKEDVSTENCSLVDVVENCKTIFVCVPTPMYSTGECDITIVKSVLVEINQLSTDLNRKTKVILKSTVPPGTCLYLNDIFTEISIVFSPEFLTEANSIKDFENQNRIILGIDWVELVEPTILLFSKVFPKADIVVLKTTEAEISKYVINLFLATKVSFFNDMYRLIDSINSNLSINSTISYDSVVEASLLDPRIGKSHYMVPGPDGDYGYGGHCFRKDMSAMLKIADDLKLAIPTILGASTTNLIVRKNRDWEEMKGRAVSENETVKDIELDFENTDLSNEY